MLLHKLLNVGQRFKNHFTVLFVLKLTYSLFIILVLIRVTLLSFEVSTAVWLRIPVILGCDAALLDKLCAMFWRNTRNNLPSLGASCLRATKSTVTLGIQYTTCLYPLSCCVICSELRNLFSGVPLYVILHNLFWTVKAYENCALLGYYAARSVNFLPMFQDNLSVPSSWVKNPKRPRGWLKHR